MNKMKSVIFAFHVALAMAPHVALAQESNAPPKVTVRELLSARERWKDTRVEVFGFYVQSGEVCALYQDQAEARPANDKKSLWIDYFDVIATKRNQIRWVKSGYMRIIGVFEYRTNFGVGYFAAWPGKLRAIELAEASTPEAWNRNPAKK